MKTKTADLIGRDLDWAVAKSMKFPNFEEYGIHTPYSSDWVEGGPIIEREKISVGIDALDTLWVARQLRHGRGDVFSGDTALIAAMRCFVASKLGDEVNVPTFDK